MKAGAGEGACLPPWVLVVTPAQPDPASFILLSPCQRAQVSENSLGFQVTVPHGSLLPRRCGSDCIPGWALLRLIKALISGSLKPGLLPPTAVCALRGCTWQPQVCCFHAFA